MRKKRWFFLSILFEGVFILQSRILNQAFLSTVTNSEEDNGDANVIIEDRDNSNDPQESQLDDNMDFINNFLSSMSVDSSLNMNEKYPNQQADGEGNESTYLEGNSQTVVKEGDRQPKLYIDVDNFERGSKHNFLSKSDSSTRAKTPTDLFLETFLKKAVSEPSIPDVTHSQAQEILHNNDGSSSYRKETGIDVHNIGNIEESFYLNATDRRLINDKDLFEYYDLKKQKLDEAQDRQLFIPFNAIDVAFVEAKYENLVYKLPKLIDTARAEIIKEIATLNMLGYSIAAGFAVGVLCDTIGVILLEEVSLGATIVSIVTDHKRLGFLWFIWWYSFGYAAPWLFPATFNGGDPNLLCSSADFFSLYNDYELTLNIQSFTEKSPGESVLLLERVNREFNLRLGCILQHSGKYKSASGVSSAFQSMLFLVNLHTQLDTRIRPEANQKDLDLLDSALQNLWFEIIDLTDQVHGEVTSRRASSAVIYVFIGFLNIMGMVGVLIMYSGIAQNRWNEVWDKDKYNGNSYPKLPAGDKIDIIAQEVLQWILVETPPPSYYIMSVGSAIWMVAPIGWGYSYWMAYFLFVEAADPGCGSLERDDVYSRYFQLGSVRDLISTGISKPAISYFLEEWRSEMYSALHCLLHTKEGSKLADAIDMFHSLVLTRLDFSP